MAEWKRSSTQHGFTLIELLVVIAIIAILAGILFPTFAMVKGNSRKVVCQSNLKQLYSAFQMYCEDWNDVLPSPGGMTGNRSYWAQEGDGIEKYLNGQQKLGLKSVYCCPAYEGEWKETRWSPRTYSMNSFLREPPDIPYPASTSITTGAVLASIESPSRTILLYEGYPASERNTSYGEGYVYRCGDWTCVRGYHSSESTYWRYSHKPWHGKRSNYLMVDGHIMTMEPWKHPDHKGGPTCEADNYWFVSKLRGGEGSSE